MYTRPAVDHGASLAPVHPLPSGTCHSSRRVLGCSTATLPPGQTHFTLRFVRKVQFLPQHKVFCPQDVKLRIYCRKSETRYLQAVEAAFDGWLKVNLQTAPLAVRAPGPDPLVNS